MPVSTAPYQTDSIRSRNPGNTASAEIHSGASSNSTSKPGRYTNTRRRNGSISQPKSVPFAMNSATLS